MRGLKIPYDVADTITLTCLKDHRFFMERDLKQHEKGEWMHPLDVQNAREFLEAVNKVIEYFGENND